MKKIFSMLIVAAAAVGFVGCGSDKASNKSPEEQAVCAIEELNAKMQAAIESGDMNRIQSVMAEFRVQAEKFSDIDDKDLSESQMERVKKAAYGTMQAAINAGIDLNDLM